MRIPVISGRLRGALLILLGSIGAGLLSGLSTVNIRIWFAGLAALLLPATLVMVSANPATSGGIIIFAQILEAFEYSTPFSSVSIATVMLLVFVALRGRETLRAVLRSKHLALLACFLVIFMLGHLLQVRYSGLGAIRSMVTLVSFFLYWFIGVRLGENGLGRRAVAVGAFSGLVVLGTLGILVSTGKIPPPPRVSAPRDLFGFISPFQRNYGLNVGFQSTALLLPLCAPRFCFNAIFGKGSLTRFLSGGGYLILLLLTILVFQSRSMLLNFGLILMITLLMAPSIWLGFRLLAAGGMVALAAIVIPQMLAIDSISSNLRSESYEYVVNYISSSPSVFLMGGNVPFVLKQIESTSRFGNLVGDAPIHNMFLGELLQGGIWSAGSLAMLFIVPIVRVVKERRRPALREQHSVVAAMLAAALLEIMINPIEANVAGLWVALGMAAVMTRPPLELPNSKVIEAAPGHTSDSSFLTGSRRTLVHS